MAELWALALTYTPALWQRRWIGVTIAWIVCLCGWPAVALIPSHYHAQARVFVDTHSLLQPLLSGIAVDIDPSQQVDILKQTLTSEQNLNSVIRVTNPNADTWSPPTMNAAVAAIRQKLRVVSNEDNVFTIGYDADSPAQAEAVVQAFLNLFLEGNFGLIRSDINSAQSFLTNQVAQYEKTMRQADEALASFKEKNADLLTSGASYGDTLQKTQADIENLTAKIQDLNAKVALYKSQLDTVPKYVLSPTSSASQDRSSTAARVQQVQAELDNLRMRYTEQHPRVIDTERLLAQLKQQAAQEAKHGGGGGNSDVSSVYQQITLQLVDTRAEIASTQTQLERRQATMASLKQDQTKIPALEAELGRLKNADDLAHSSYQELAARLQSAKLSGDRESEVNRVQFRVIDPPQMPTAPSGVKRSLLLSVVLAGGIALGGIAILVRVLLQHTFVDARRLQKVIDYPVLGSISRLEVPREKQLHLLKSGMFVASVLVLLIAYSGLLLVERNYGVSVLVPNFVKSSVPSLAARL
jgi:polysaccharide chain length determinant protein (PEP-CTERM system associated)